MKDRRCIDCIYNEQCSPFEQQIENNDGNCKLYIGLDFYESDYQSKDFDGEYYFVEMSYYKYSEK